MNVIGPVAGTYHEPFLGSATVFLALKPQRALLGDLNANLMNCYRAIQSDPHKVTDHLMEIPLGEAAYYGVREKFPDSQPSLAAAQFLYLNTFCFNGLYRENSQGRFNVPYGRPKNNNLPTRQALVSLALALEKATLLKPSPFQAALQDVRSGDTVYLDPPYVAGHRANGFVDYNRHLFKWSDQLDLATEFRRMNRAGARLFLSNADHQAVRDLYRDFSVTQFSRHSSMAGKKESRGRTQEILVSNVKDGDQWQS